MLTISFVALENSRCSYSHNLPTQYDLHSLLVAKHGCGRAGDGPTDCAASSARHAAHDAHLQENRRDVGGGDRCPRGKAINTKFCIFLIKCYRIHIGRLQCDEACDNEFKEQLPANAAGSLSLHCGQLSDPMLRSYSRDIQNGEPYQYIAND